jgi:DNA-3-methyladenine glycosylase I
MGLIKGEDSLMRCGWCGEDPLYQAYHDHEWGKPVTGNVAIYERLILELFQSGLSWLTILRKRENFRSAFDNFDYNLIALYSDEKIADLLSDAGIVRHRGKIEATITNARATQELIREYGSFSDYLQEYLPSESERPKKLDWDTLIATATSPTSAQLSKDLRSRGYIWVGPTTIYAWMQSIGMVDDHLDGCHALSAKELMSRVNRAN